MLKRIGFVALFLVVFVLMIWFTSINPGSIEIDLAFFKINPSIPVALAITFVLGWAFGLLTVAFYVAKLLNERRRLRHALRDSQSEVSSLRNLPIADAD